MVRIIAVTVNLQNNTYLLFPDTEKVTR
jgi:hypothetical protein